jgi:UDP-N-acetylglucosamine 2-epimerase
MYYEIITSKGTVFVYGDSVLDAMDRFNDIISQYVNKPYILSIKHVELIVRDVK